MEGSIRAPALEPRPPGSRLATLRSPALTSDESGITSLALYHTALAPAAGATGAEDDGWLETYRYEARATKAITTRRYVLRIGSPPPSLPEGDYRPGPRTQSRSHEPHAVGPQGGGD